MKKFIKTSFFTILALLSSFICMFSACAFPFFSAPEQQKNFEEQQQNATSVLPPIEKEGYKVLFIGNSYTYYNNSVKPDPTVGFGDNNSVYELFERLTRSAGYPVQRVDAVYSGGYTLERYCDPANDMCQKLTDTLNANVYDIVFVQEHSQRPVIEQELFFTYARKMVQRIKDSGAKRVIFYQTWGRKEGSSDLEKNGLTNETMTRGLAQSYQVIATELNSKELPVSVSPAGSAVYYAHSEHPELGLYRNDKSHPTSLMSYTVACTHFMTAFEESPVGFNILEGTTQETLDILETSAERAIANPVI